MGNNEKMQAEMKDVLTILTNIVISMQKTGVQVPGLSVDDLFRLKNITKSWSEDKNN